MEEFGVVGLGFKKYSKLDYQQESSRIFKTGFLEHSNLEKNQIFKKQKFGMTLFYFSNNSIAFFSLILNTFLNQLFESSIKTNLVLFSFF